MKIIETGIGQQPIRQTARAPVVVNRGRSPSDKKVSSLAEVTTTSVAGDQATFGRLQAINEHSNREALRIRADQRKEETKETPYRIIKNYPPYPIDDPERVKFLMSFNGLKREIEQMTIPPDSKWQGTVPGENNPPAETDSALLITSSDIPFPSQPAPNTDVSFTAPALSSAAPDTAGVSQEKLAVLATLAGKDLDLLIPGEAEALAACTRARQELAVAMNGSITAAQSPLLALAV
ncbi:MAG: hypothetical protein HY787_04960 [Deltaproteobacteria bacterium]|nr:hypothetical protein [Deltaproteobacteria bacterium]